VISPDINDNMIEMIPIKTPVAAKPWTKELMSRPTIATPAEQGRWRQL